MEICQPCEKVGGRGRNRMDIRKRQAGEKGHRKVREPHEPSLRKPQSGDLNEVTSVILMDVLRSRKNHAQLKVPRARPFSTSGRTPVGSGSF